MATTPEGKIRRLIHQHMEYVAGWKKDDSFSLLRENHISPRGKRCTHAERDKAINDHMDKTVEKILAIKEGAK